MSASLGFRIFGGFGLVILLTLGVAGVVFFSLLGGYRDALDRNALQQVADQVLFGVNQIAGRNVTATELASYLQTQSEQTGTLVFILDADGRVVQDLSPDAAYNQLQLPISLRDVQRQPIAWVPGEVETTGKTLPFLARVVPVGRFGRGAFYRRGVARCRCVRSDRGSLPAPAAQRACRVGSGADRGRVDHALNRMTHQVDTNQRTLQSFMADVSHELRTPLTSIRGFMQALRDGTAMDPQRQERSTAIIDEEARRMLRLVEDLLDLSRMQAGEFRLQQVATDTGELIAHVAEVFRQRAEESGLALHTEVSEGMPPLHCDYDRLVQVLTNLTDNALQHTEAGSVTLRATTEPETNGLRMLLTVEDTGEGIPPAEIDRLFDRFYRAESTAKRRGTGLGLAISREIVRAHGGEIIAASTEGVGTRFRITLPVDGRAPPRIEAR